MRTTTVLGRAPAFYGRTIQIMKAAPQRMAIGDFVRSMPKVELHVHLDGAFDSERLCVVCCVLCCVVLCCVVLCVVCCVLCCCVVLCCVV